MKTVLATTLALAIAGTTSMAFAETVKYSTKDNYAYAIWHNSDDCSYSSLDVSATESATRQTGSGPITSSYVGVYYSSSNWCTGEYQYGAAYGAGNVGVGPKSMTVQATLDTVDYMTGENVVIDVDLTFVGNGEYVTKGVSNNVTIAGPVRTRYRNVGSSESADVSGTVTQNGTSLITTELAWAGIGKSNNGTIEITKPDA